MIPKGGKRIGWLEFEISGDPSIDGKILNVRQLRLSVADHTGKRYSLEFPELPFTIEAPKEKLS
jgi:hypothetical protein